MVAKGRARKTVGNPHGGLQGERVERGRQVGCREKYTAVANTVPHIRSMCEFCCGV